MAVLLRGGKLILKGVGGRVKIFLSPKLSTFGVGCYGISSGASINIFLTSQQGIYSKFLVGGGGLEKNKNKPLSS